MLKMKDLLKEHSISIAGGLVTQKPVATASTIKLAPLVKEKFGEVEEEREIDVEGFMGAVSNFGSLGKQIYREGNLRDVAKTLSELAVTARAHTLRETDDWFDKVTVNRNMKELTNLSKSFNKVATEAQSLQERMSGLYEDMGHLLSRYYEINEESGDKEAYQKFFQMALSKFGVSSPDEFGSDEEKKAFYDYVDKNWAADKETD
tara:strand:- start:53 stop:667 length:615 start_codon:yes stop_codon:yes gene_type:complete